MQEPRKVDTSCLVFSGRFHLTDYKLVTFSGGSETGSPVFAANLELLKGLFLVLVSVPEGVLHALGSLLRPVDDRPLDLRPCLSLDFIPSNQPTSQPTPTPPLFPSPPSPKSGGFSTHNPHSSGVARRIPSGSLAWGEQRGPSRFLFSFCFGGGDRKLGGGCRICLSWHTSFPVVFGRKTLRKPSDFETPWTPNNTNGVAGLAFYRHIGAFDGNRIWAQVSVEPHPGDG